MFLIHRLLYALLCVHVHVSGTTGSVLIREVPWVVGREVPLYCVSMTFRFHSRRTPGTGLYDNLQQYKIPDPTAIFDISFFVHNPKPFFTLARELYPGRYQPNTVHYFVRLLQEKGVLLRNYTQNIDGLERREFTCTCESPGWVGTKAYRAAKKAESLVFPICLHICIRCSTTPKHSQTIQVVSDIKSTTDIIYTPVYNVDSVMLPLNIQCHVH